MKKITLWKTGIEVSYLGFGTGTTDYAVDRTKQSMLEEKELADLLLRGKVSFALSGCRPTE